MFESLKKKLGNWLGKEEPVKPKEKVKKKQAGKEKKKKTVSKTKEKKEEKLEEVKEEQKESKKGFLGKLFAKKEIEKEDLEEKQGLISKTFSGKIEIEKEDIEEKLEELELILLENNVALDAVDKIKEDLEKKLIGKTIKKSEISETVLNALKESILSVLQDPEDLIKRINEKKGVFTIVFFGINGSGKTTSLAKLAYKLKKQGINSVLVAGDTFRAASIEQLETHGKNLGIKVIKHNYGSDPAAVGFDAKKYAQENGIKCVLMDTAGRMYTKDNLLREMEKIIRVVQPDLKIFVGESITGNDATEQAKTFNEVIGMDGIILTKADVDEKGGTALSVSYVTNKPIYFLGMGQDYKDFKDFKKTEIIKSLGI